MKGSSKGAKAPATAAASGADKASVSLPPVNAKGSSPFKAPAAKNTGTAAKAAATDGKNKLPSIGGVKPDGAVAADKSPPAEEQLAVETAIDSLLSAADTAAPVVPTDAPLSAFNAPLEVSTPMQTEVVPDMPAVPAYKPEEHNGMVKLIYEQYNEEFPIVNGSTTQENVDEVYCLSFVMPNCLIHLSALSPPEKRAKDIASEFEGMYLEENPRGTYQGMLVNTTYYVYVEQEAQQLARDQEIMRQRAQGKAPADTLKKDDGRVLESCSCIYGNPCVDEYGCKDWANRCAVATKNGWKGF